MIDLLEPSDFKSDVRNAARITITGKARLNQKRFARRGHDERRGATLNVNEVDIERLWRGRHPRPAERSQRHKPNRRQSFLRLRLIAPTGCPASVCGPRSALTRRELPGVIYRCR